jgi:hypothetical protein
MTFDEQLEVGRVSHELANRLGNLRAYHHAVGRVGKAQAVGNEEEANFWEWVAASLKPRELGEA